MKKLSIAFAVCSLVGFSLGAIAIAGASRRGFDLRHSMNIFARNESRASQRNQEGRLRREARNKGHHVETWDDPQWKHPLTVKALVKSSSLVVLGRPIRNTCKLSVDGNQLTIDYDVEVSEVIKGNTIAGSHLLVRLPGGLIRFQDGTSAEVRTPTFRKMVSGRRYVLFLSPGDANGNTFVVTGGPQGLFEISPDGSRLTHFSADLTSPPPQPQNLDSVLAEVRDALKK